MGQTGEGKLPFDNIPEGTDDVQLFNDMHSPLLNGEKFVKKGCTLVFLQRNAHVIKRSTWELIKQIMNTAEREDSDDIVMTVPFDKNKSHMENRL